MGATLFFYYGPVYSGKSKALLAKASQYDMRKLRIRFLATVCIRGAVSHVSSTGRAAMDDVGPRAALLGGRWPFCAHTVAGMAGQIMQAFCCRGTNAVAHMGLMFERLAPEDAALARAYGLVEIAVPHVFELFNDGSKPSFRSLVAPPWSETRSISAHYVVCSPVANETVEVYVRNVFLACVRICKEGSFEYRWGPHCNLACPCCCCDCTRLFTTHGTVGGREGNCISVLLLALALGVDPMVRMPYEVVQTLRLDGTRPRCACCRTEAVLAAYGPPEALLALQRAGVLAHEEHEYRHVEGMGAGVRHARHVHSSDRVLASRAELARDLTEGIW